MEKVLCSYATGEQAELLELVAPHYRAFAERHGYQLELRFDEVQLDGRSPHWGKIAFMREILGSTDVCLWVDCDFVLRGDGDLLAGMLPEDFQGLVMEQTPHGPGPNTGLWALRNCEEAHEFLELVWETGQLPDAKLHDQATVAHLLGFSYLPWITKPVHASPWLAHTGWLDRRWNMISVYHPEAPLVAYGIHYGGMNLAEKRGAIINQLIRGRLPGWEEGWQMMMKGDPRSRIVSWPHPDDHGS